MRQKFTLIELLTAVCVIGILRVSRGGIYTVAIPKGGLTQAGKGLQQEAFFVDFYDWIETGKAMEMPRQQVNNGTAAELE